MLARIAAFSLTVALALIAAPSAQAGVDPTGAFTFTETTVQLRLNPSGPTIPCTSASYSGTATGSATMTVTPAFGGCTWPITCAAGGGSLALSPITPTVASAVLGVSANACQAVGPGCTIRLGAFSAVATQIEGTPGSATMPVTGNTDAIPFTSTGFSCGFASIPPSGTMTFSQAGGTLTFAQTAGTDMSWT